MKLSRRDFLKFSAYTIVVSTGLSSCGSDSSSTTSSETQKYAKFSHGVASGDPLSDSLIIWTRVTTNETEVDVAYEVSENSDFSELLHDGVETVTADTDYTLKIDVQNLLSNRKYYYRFKVGETVSPVGMGKTLPVGDVDEVKFGVFSCANYTNGYFNVYKEASKEDIDVSIHLGDYIYEYGMFESDGVTPAYGTEKAVEIGRALPSDNSGEAISLEDYRKRYALYRSDSSLQELHRIAPMIAVWDDHEIANDTYKYGAENHSSSEGSFEARKNAAIQAYYEWLPIRPVDDREKIYRSFNFGNLVSLNMLETRVIARDKQLDSSDYLDSDGGFRTEEFTAELLEEDRTLIGDEQLEWLDSEFTNSSATWQVLGQQVLMSKIHLPAEILSLLQQLSVSEEKEALMTQIDETIEKLTLLKFYQNSGSSLSDEDLARLETRMPYNLDAWDGYFAERERVFAKAKELNKNLVVLAGDTHNSWSSNLRDVNGDIVGVEFATSSVSSPGLENDLSLDSSSAQDLENALSVLIDDLKYVNLYERGFMLVTFYSDEVKSEWRYVDNTDSEEYTVSRSKEIVVQKGSTI